jgi:hypothetical protein
MYSLSQENKKRITVENAIRAICQKHRIHLDYRGGEVKSRNDGTISRVSRDQVMRLYGGGRFVHDIKTTRSRLFYLRPRNDGIYGAEGILLSLLEFLEKKEYVRQHFIDLRLR